MCNAFYTIICKVICNIILFLYFALGGVISNFALGGYCDGL